MLWLLCQSTCLQRRYTLSRLLIVLYLLLISLILSGSFYCARFTVPLNCTSNQQSSYRTSIFLFIYFNLSIQIPPHSKSSVGELIARIITEDIGISGCFHYCVKPLLLFSYLFQALFIQFSRELNFHIILFLQGYMNSPFFMLVYFHQLLSSPLW